MGKDVILMKGACPINWKEVRDQGDCETQICQGNSKLGLTQQVILVSNTLMGIHPQLFHGPIMNHCIELEGVQGSLYWIRLIGHQGQIKVDMMQAVNLPSLVNKVITAHHLISEMSILGRDGSTQMAV